MKTVRSYNKLVNEIINLNIPFRIEIIGYVEYNKVIYPMIAIKHISKTAKKAIMITSGVHGNEYYAVHVLLKWMQQINVSFINDFNFYIYPIINPFGYAKNYRDNGARQDVNKSDNYCKNSKVQEASILFDNFPLTADMILDIHGDIDKEQVYCYEHKGEGLPSIAEKAMLDNDIILPFIKTKTIYQIKIKNGVCEDREETGFEEVLEKLGTTYCVTLELPGKINSQKRTSGAIAIINSILKNFNEIK